MNYKYSYTFEHKDMKKLTIAVGLLIFTAINLTAQSWQNKIDHRLDQYENTTIKFEFLIQFVEQANLSQSIFIKDKTAKGTFVMQQLQSTAKKTQAEVIDILECKGVPYQNFWVSNVIWVYSDYELVTTLAQRSDVKKISENSSYKMLEPINPEVITENLNKSLEIPWGILQVNANKVWKRGYKGEGVVIGGQDTGYEWEHESLKESYRGWDGTSVNHNYSWHDAIHDYSPNHDTQANPCGLDSDVPCDDHNHGTHTMGTMTGETQDMKIGVAPEAKWIGCRNMERGWGTPQTYLECFQWFLAPTNLENENPDPSKAPHVINNSWSCPDIEGCNPNNFDIMEAAVNSLKSAGIVVVVSAGNSGSNCETINTPAAIFENSFTVGAIGEDEIIAPFSSRGTVAVDGSNRMKPNVTAPGVNVKSAIRGGNLYANFSGTSMAGPHVAGIVALLISADSTLSGDVERIENLIEETAIDRITTQNCNYGNGNDIPNYVYGHGTIDAFAALEKLLIEKPTTTEENLLVYPNPTSDAINFQKVGTDGMYVLQIFTIEGKLVINQNLDFNGGNKIRTVNIANLAKGIYIYRLCDDSNTNCSEGKILKN